MRPHPLTLLRTRMDHRSITTLADLQRLPPDPAHTAGIVLVRQRPPSARGVVFLTLEDETGSLNVIVPRSLVERAESVVATSALIEIHGCLERDGEVVQLLARRLIDRSDWLGKLTMTSRDFS